MTPAERAAFLREEIERHNALYYQQEKPEISDAEWDKLFRELVELEQAHPELRTPDSPTQRVGAPPVEGFEQFKHRIPMLSLDNAFSDGELREFDVRVRKGLETAEPVEYLVELKFDGLSISLDYEDGLLIRATTRGDGTTGEVVTHNAKTVRGIPLRLNSEPKTISGVRGEILMFKSVFAELNKERVARGETPFANPRNASSGGMRQLDSRLTAKRRLNFFAYSVAQPPPGINSQSESIALLKKLGFSTYDFQRVAHGIDEVIAITKQAIPMRDTLPFGVDGLVIKVNRFDEQSILGATSRGPKWAIAFKFPAEQAYTLLEKISASVGRTGVVTPFAELAPVFVGGVTITRATLHNYEDLLRRDVREGDTVLVQRAGEVIPEVVGAVLDKRPKDSHAPAPPTACPECGAELVREEGMVAIRCPNRNCPAQMAQKIIHFASRKALDIETLGEKNVMRLLDLGYLSDVASVFSLHQFKEQLLALERMGEQSVDNLLNAIEQAKTRPLDRFLYALGIRFVGDRTAKDIAREFGTLEKFRRASYDTLISIPDVGPRTASEIEEWLESDENQAMLDRMLSLGLAPVESERPIGDIFNGKTLVFTGKLEKFTREAAEKAVMKLGGKAAGSVSKLTSLVVAGPGAGSKLAKAEQFGVPVIDEEEFLAMLPEGIL